MRPSQDLDGFFGKFHEPSRALGDWETSNSISGPSMAQSGTKKKGGSESTHFPSWGAPEEVGMFGRFVDFDENVPIITRDRGLKSNTGGWSEPLFSPPSYATGESCHRIINRRCTVDEQCLCASQNMLRCRLGKCSNYHSYTGEENKYGFWHDGPLPSSQLGLHKRLQKRRSDKSIFM
ncbi:uncharacterized protein CEXT_781511 [Caerostris extrusa]|uniref:C3H1-type domain-containing protein n=1 Tax=Caerostris extrusa TaxID=172846 RepID=A0AAV4SVU2_CAEEX|nr:uncharacterized protein CEXT_781511 [Caerostris extrusa]